MSTPLLSYAQMEAIRGYGERAMITDVTFTRMLPYAADPNNPFGDGEVAYETHTVTTKGWVLNYMRRDFDEVGNRVVSVHDMTVRVPHYIDVEPKDLATIGDTQYTVVESNNEDSWAEWITIYLKAIS